MRRHLTTGIKAILTVAALTTAAHWTMRLQREPIPQIASVPAIADDPVTTGSIGQREVEAPAPSLFVPAASSDNEFDQQHLARLFGDAAKPNKPTGRH